MKRLFGLMLALFLIASAIPIAASAESALDGKTIIAFGDSLTEGTAWWVSNGLDTYPDILAENFPNSEIINAGARGDSTYNALLRFESDVLTKSPDIVLICFGMNDQAWEIGYDRPIQTLDRYRAQLVHFVTELQAIGADVIFITPNPVYEEEYEPTASNNYEYGLMDDYCNEMREIALEYSCGLIDINYEIEKRGVSQYVGTDGIHQTEKGHLLYAQCITDYLKAVYDNQSRAEATVNYFNENGDIIGTHTYIGATNANITVATPAHLGCNPISEDIQAVLTDGAVFELIFENEMLLSYKAKYTTTAPNRASGDKFNDDTVRLSDGTKGSEDPSAKAYSGWNKTEQGYVEVTFDLGEAKKSNVYRIYTAGGPWGISPASKISIALSDDAISFGDEIAVSSTLENYCDGKTVDGTASKIYTITAEAEQAYVARYIRFRIYPSSGNGFVWIDEAEVIYDSSIPEDKPEQHSLGDVNDDGKIDQYDYILVKRHYFETRILSSDEALRADVNRDGKVDQYDYILIARHYFGTFVIG